MPERTGYAHGTPNWVDLATTDIDGAKAFYSAVFGWEAETMPTDDQGGTYTMFAKNGKHVAGMGTLPAEMAAAGTPPAWSTYIAVDDVDAAIAKATAAGGGVMMPAMDVIGSGRMAFITDTTGAAVGLWEAKEFFGSQLANEHGAFTWNELVTDDTATAQKFYADALGLGAQTDETPNGPYTTFMVGGKPVGGMMPKNENMGPIPNYWGTYFAVDDCDGCLEVVKANGGEVLMQAFDVAPGRMAVVKDPQGAVFSVIQLAEPGQ
jgi:predicted enzyme related to lactoylglutathione lyase